jgi:hypothetical protein
MPKNAPSEGHPSEKERLWSGSAFFPHSFRIIAENPHFQASFRNRSQALANPAHLL